MKRLWLDLETYSELDLKAVGGYVYTANCEILLFAYAFDDGPVKVWDRTLDYDVPDELAHALLNAEEVWAHNAMFDRSVIENQTSLFAPALESWRCSMAQALSHALPGSLSELCKVLKVPEDLGKLKEGKKLVGLFTKPQPANRKVRRATRETHPDEWARFIAYAANDIEAMRECCRRMPTWNWGPESISEWHLDQRCNDRGFLVDRELTQAGARAAVQEKEALAKRFVELTGGTVDAPTKRAAFQALLNERYGLGLDNTRSNTFEILLKERKDLPAECRELMQISMAANKTSTAKYAALDAAIGTGGRFRGGFQFSGAGRTRRDAGRIFQPQNLPSRGLPPPDEIESYIECLKAGTHSMFFTDLMKFGAAALRGVIVAPPGKKLCVADLSNIEGRVLAWLAGEEWKLKAFREYDAGTGPDLYNITAASILGGDPWKVAKKDRNVFGKVPDLASGYQGGVAGYQTFAKAYGVKMADHWETIQKAIAPEHIRKARDNFQKPWAQKQVEEMGISPEEWIASETCKLAWRSRHPATVGLWYRLQDAVKDAIWMWGSVHNVGEFLKVGCVTHEGFPWLLIKLPSGRYLTYFAPGIENDSITYWGEASEAGSTTRAWVKNYTHGGKMTGNCCQTIARDVLFFSMPEAERQQYLPIGRVHDELLCETPDDPTFSGEGLAAIMAINPPWAKTLPLAAAGFEGSRYRKE